MTTIQRTQAMFLVLAVAGWSQTSSRNKAAEIDALTASYVTTGKSPGLAVGVMRAGKIVLAKGYGLADIERSLPVTPNTAFHINSITKQFTAAGIMLLVERGLVRTDDLLVKFLPDFPRSSEITVRQLLTHTAGLATYDGRPEFREFAVAPHSVSQLIDWIRPAPFVADPGAAWNYSNSGFALLAGIIEKVRGRAIRYSCKRTCSVPWD